MAKANPMTLQMLPITFKMSISATSWNQIPARLRYFAFLSAYAGSQATVFLPSTVWMSKHDRRRWVFTIPIILGEWASVNVCKSQGHPGYSPKQRAIWCARWLAVFMLIGFPQSDKLESVEVIRRERIYPFRRGNVFIRGILNGKMLDNTVGRVACPRRNVANI